MSSTGFQCGQVRCVAEGGDREVREGRIGRRREGKGRGQCTCRGEGFGWLGSDLVRGEEGRAGGGWAGEEGIEKMKK